VMTDALVKGLQNIQHALEVLHAGLLLCVRGRVGRGVGAEVEAACPVSILSALGRNRGSAAFATCIDCASCWSVLHSHESDPFCTALDRDGLFQVMQCIVVLVCIWAGRRPKAVFFQAGVPPLHQI